ncbi:MAG TPA: alpha-amylase family glycosyl hydrolase, partial [Burkholderiaceae bacterium]|nr:alpha-amylase family glycosyl hydrolase [Burkholderiaceae bacterium]
MQKASPVLPKAPPVAPEDRPIRALLIEDNPRLGELTVRYLHSHGILADLVPDRYVSYESEVGRSTANTAKALAKLASVPPVVIVSSGTNDGTAAELTTGATTILDALGSQRCVVWVDVVRPDTVGDTQQQMNAALDAVAAGRTNVTILRWSEMVAAHPEWFRTGCVCGTDNCDWTGHALDCMFAAYLPDINHSVPEANAAFVADAVYWLDEFDLDGLRVDAVKHVEEVATRNLAAAVRETFEPAGTKYFLMGETAMGWNDAPDPGNDENYGTIA